jgi:hypothetical protein
MGSCWTRGARLQITPIGSPAEASEYMLRGSRVEMRGGKERGRKGKEGGGGKGKEAYSCQLPEMESSTASTTTPI